ncbi:MAG: hypothetical protein H7839_11855 [Magnetococcus sp. YQC-5]
MNDERNHLFGFEVEKFMAVIKAIGMHWTFDPGATSRTVLGFVGWRQGMVGGLGVTQQGGAQGFAWFGRICNLGMGAQRIILIVYNCILKFTIDRI